MSDQPLSALSGSVLTVCVHCWCVVAIDGKTNEDRPMTVCSHLRGVTATVALDQIQPDLED